MGKITVSNRWFGDKWTLDRAYEMGFSHGCSVMRKLMSNYVVKLGPINSPTKAINFGMTPRLIHRRKRTAR